MNSKEAHNEAKRLAKLNGPTANILTPKLAGWSDGEKALFLADSDAIAIAQNLIDAVEDHRHLREAAILVLFETGKTPDPDGRTQLGKATKATPRMRLLTGGAKGVQADFEVRLNGDAWIDFGPAARAALVDHELSHCAATIAGRWMPEGKAAIFAEALGADHVETHSDARDETGRILVRYFKRRGEIKPGDEGYGKQPLVWRMRKHSVEEFTTVVGRWGAWDATLLDLVDVLDPADDGQLALDLHADESEPGGDYDEAEQIAATIAKAPQDIATKAIAACESIDILQAAAAHDQCTGDWRRAAIAKRIEELKAAQAA